MQLLASPLPKNGCSQQSNYNISAFSKMSAVGIKNTNTARMLQIATPLFQRRQMQFRAFTVSTAAYLKNPEWFCLSGAGLPRLTDI